MANTDARAARDLQIVDPVLTNVARAYRPMGFVYNEIAPRIQVDKDSGKFPVYTLDSFFGDESDSGNSTKVSDRAPTPEISFEWSTDTYLCEDYRLKFTITAKERAQAHAALRLETAKLQGLLDRFAIRREVRLATVLQDSGVSGGQLTGGTSAPSNNWDQDTATIESDIKTGALAVRGKIGRMTNTLLFDLKVAYAVALQADIRQILQYTVPGDRILLEGAGILPAQLHRHRVVVADCLRNTAAYGSTASLSEIWSDTARLLYVDPNAGWGVPSVAYSFTNIGETVDRWHDNDPPVDNVRAWEDVDEKICAPDAGYTLTGLLS